MEGLDLEERIRLEALLEDAYASLREQTCDLSPRRVRAAVRWGRGAPPAARPWSGVLRRVSELTVAASATLVVLASALTSGHSGVPGAERSVDVMRLEQRPYVREALEAYRTIWLLADLRSTVSVVQGVAELRRLGEPPAFDADGLDRYGYLAGPVRVTPADRSAAH